MYVIQKISVYLEETNYHSSNQEWKRVFLLKMRVKEFNFTQKCIMLSKTALLCVGKNCVNAEINFPQFTDLGFPVLVRWSPCPGHGWLMFKLDPKPTSSPRGYQNILGLVSCTQDADGFFFR